MKQIILLLNIRIFISLNIILKDRNYINRKIREKIKIVQVRTTCKFDIIV